MKGGGFNSGLLWRLKNKLRPKYNKCSTAMIYINGKLVTKGEEWKKLTMEHYKRVLTNKPNTISDRKGAVMPRKNLRSQ